jgi:uncharacterized protein YigE (DUF2233 family)
MAQFIKHSIKIANLNIRNGVGILPNNEILFMSTKEITYEFANFLKK